MCLHSRFISQMFYDPRQSPVFRCGFRSWRVLILGHLASLALKCYIVQQENTENLPTSSAGWHSNVSSCLTPTLPVHRTFTMQTSWSWRTLTSGCYFWRKTCLQRGRWGWSLAVWGSISTLWRHNCTVANRTVFHSVCQTLQALEHSLMNANIQTLTILCLQRVHLAWRTLAQVFAGACVRACVRACVCVSVCVCVCVCVCVLVC